MDRPFLWLFFSCLLVAGAALKCITCHLRSQTDRCRRGFGVCLAQRQETCMTLKAIQGGELQVSYMVCQRFCRDLTLSYNDRTYVHTCCRSNYCNFKI
ncbi:prostate and testis expressed protein 3 [Tupaia chinensis]|uniref:prostate and testis expressed protein 3 n=1 Tax=Tupaia chinensis TaxID=246437 RepID=UPI0003C8F815|nr:prostate and testis expressed protein 3 [Tupaia chinensis]